MITASGQGIPTAEAEVSTFNLRGVTKMKLSSVVVAQDETQSVTPELVNQVMHGMHSKDEEVTLFGGAAQVMTNTSTLPTISKEELALLAAADLLCEAEEYDVEGNRVRNYEEAKANFLATRKEF